MTNHEGDKCYGSTASSNLAGVGSTPASPANLFSVVSSTHIQQHER